MSMTVSTPSRICLFGEHLDYLGLEVIALAIDLRFTAEIFPRSDAIIHVEIRSDKFSETSIVPDTVFVFSFNCLQKLTYSNNRDYFRSVITVLSRHGLQLQHGYDIFMRSDIPVGKGMSSSSAMIIAYIKALLEAEDHPLKDSPVDIAYFAYCAEVEEFGEPGGMMDQYTSALGGLINLDFHDKKPVIRMLDSPIPGVFLLFDSLSDKKTSVVLSSGKEPVLRAVKKLRALGITGEYLTTTVIPDDAGLTDEEIRKLTTARENYRLLHEAKRMILTGVIDPLQFGLLLIEHHEYLRDGLGISTPAIESILATALKSGAWGGKLNGSGGGGCVFVYCSADNADSIMQAVGSLGFPGRIIRPDGGVRREPQ